LDKIVEVPKLQFKPAEPINLLEVLEAQARRLIEIGVPKEVNAAEDKFLDDAMAKAKEFRYSIKLANIGLNRVCMVHYGVRDRFLAEVGEVVISTDPHKFTLYKGVLIPEGLWIGQFQLGQKYLNCAAIKVRNCHDDLEELGIVKEGLTAYSYWGDDLLKDLCMDLPGSYDGTDDVLKLSFSQCGYAIELCHFNGKIKSTDSGSVTRGKYQ
jgi:hypothetical protein